MRTASVTPRTRNRAAVHRKQTSRAQQARGRVTNGPGHPANRLWQQLEPRAKLAVSIVAAVVAILVYHSTLASNGFASFPLDDAWIHLTFARTLATTGRFAYGALNTATSGSTSPLFTFIEALLFFITKDEFAVALIPLILAYMAATYCFFLLVQKFTNVAWLPLVGSILFLAAPSLAILPSWGMETMLVIALLLWATLEYTQRRWFALALALGLALWARPDTLVFDLALALDYFWSRKRDESRPKAKAFVPLLLLALLYFGFNFALSGTPLPNTFYAKLAYYHGSHPEFWAPLWTLAAGDGCIIAFVLAAVGALWVLTRKRGRNLVLVAYPVGLILLYRWKLPLLFQDGRYLVPMLPFIMLLAVIGAANLAAWVGKNLATRTTALATVLLLAAAIGEFAGVGEASKKLAFEDAYIHNLQFATAHWCAKNLPASGVIATHDIGAFGFYSGRKIVDLAGLATPAMIPYLGKPGAALALRKRGVTYAALLDNWYEIPNENTLYVDAPPGSETMRVYFFTDSSRFTGPKVLPIHRYLYDVLHGSADPSQFQEAMREAIQYEPDNALTYTLGGEILIRFGKREAAASAFRNALELFPNSTRALDGLRQSVQSQ